MSIGLLWTFGLLMMIVGSLFSTFVLGYCLMATSERP